MRRPAEILGIVEAAGERDPFGRRQPVENLRPLLLRQIFEQVDRVVRIEFAHAFGDGGGRQFVEDLLADRIVDLDQGGEVEIRAHQLDQGRPELRIERLEQRADVGLVQRSDQLAQALDIGRGDGIGYAGDIVGTDVAVLVAQRLLGRKARCLGHVFCIEHAGSRWTGDERKGTRRLYAADDIVANLPSAKYAVGRKRPQVGPRPFED